jgi:hypothetical protein
VASGCEGGHHSLVCFWLVALRLMVLRVGIDSFLLWSYVGSLELFVEARLVNGELIM